MKNIPLLFALVFPWFLKAQLQSVEPYLAANFTQRTNNQVFKNKIKGRIGYDLGATLVFKAPSDRLRWTSSFRAAVYRDQYTSEGLRWGTQHDGTGGINEDSLLTYIRYRHAHFFMEFPVGARYYLLHKKARFFIESTFAPSLFLTERTHFRHFNAEKTLDENTNWSHDGAFVRSLNFTAGLNLGLEIPLSKRTNLLVQPHARIFLLGNGQNGGDARLWAAGLRAGVAHYFKK